MDFVYVCVSSIVVKKAEDNATSRTNRSDTGSSPRQQRFTKGKGAKVDEVLSVTKDDMAASVAKTFSYFTRAIVSFCMVHIDFL